MMKSLIRKIICSFIGHNSVMIYKKIWNERDPYDTTIIISTEVEDVRYRCERCGAES